MSREQISFNMAARDAVKSWRLHLSHEKIGLGIAHAMSVKKERERIVDSSSETPFNLTNSLQCRSDASREADA